MGMKFHFTDSICSKSARTVHSWIPSPSPPTQTQQHKTKKTRHTQNQTITTTPTRHLMAPAGDVPQLHNKLVICVCAHWKRDQRRRKKKKKKKKKDNQIWPQNNTITTGSISRKKEKQAKKKKKKKKAPTNEQTKSFVNIKSPIFHQPNLLNRVEGGPVLQGVSYVAADHAAKRHC